MPDNSLRGVILCGAIACLVLPGSAIASQMTTPAFGPSAIVEGFEGYSAGANIEVSVDHGTGYLVPGVTGPFTFTSGVVLVAPVPNANGPNPVMIGNYAGGNNANWGLGDNGPTSPAVLPGGTAYLGYATLDGTLRLEFPSAVSAVGVWADTCSGGSCDDLFTMRVYDSGMNLLESASISGVDVASWNANFIGIEYAGIRYVEFSGDYFVVDNLTYTVPEPATCALLGAGLLALLARRRNRTV